MKPEVEFSCTTKMGGAVIFYCAGMRQALPRQFYNENTINRNNFHTSLFQLFLVSLSM